jgi:uncharacterized membrane protein (DUF4010 family)
MEIDVAFRFAVAVCLGVLVGLERERTQDHTTAFAGVRTFALISLLGATASYLEIYLHLPWLALAAFVMVSALVIASHIIVSLRGKMGITTEVTAILAFLIGALCLHGSITVAAAVGVACTLLLALKDWLHRLASHIASTDVEAALKFSIVTVIILPLLPNRTFGPPPFNIINPFILWLMVVLICGLNFVSYLLVKVMDKEQGLGLTGLLGGLVSSTALTLGFAQRSRNSSAPTHALALGILISWTVMFVRMIVIVWVVNPSLGRHLLLGVGLLALISVVISLVLWRQASSGETGTVVSGENPFELGQAIKFGLLFGIIMVMAKVAEIYLGQRGLYLAGAVGGLADVDAVALSMAQFSLNAVASPEAATRAIIIGALANTLTKTGLVLWIGSPALRRAILPAAGILSVASLAAIFFLH